MIRYIQYLLVVSVVLFGGCIQTEEFPAGNTTTVLCPSSCDDGDKYTRDYCSADTDYQCRHETINYTFSFYINETLKSIDGDVYLNGVFLGTTRNGTLSLPKKRVTEGVLNFAGEYMGRGFNFSYNVYKSGLNADNMVCVASLRDLTFYVLKFRINETGEPLDGRVYLNNKHLGDTSSGVLSLDVRGLVEGTVNLNGSHKGKDFVFYFDFGKDNLRYSSTDFLVSQDEINNLLFNASEFNSSKIEANVFDSVNREREKAGIAPLRWNGEIADVAREYSREMVAGGFHHTDTSGGKVGDRLKKQGIFYIVAGENLFMTTNLNYGNDEASVSEMAVEGWLESPGHRALIMDRDGLYSDAGVGAFCAERYCYITMNFAGMESHISVNLAKGYCWFYTIYDPSYPFDFNVPARIRLNSTQKLDAYVIPDKSGFDDCVARKDIAYVREYEYASKVDDTITAKKGYCLLLDTTRAKGDSNISVSIDYRDHTG